MLTIVDEPAEADWDLLLARPAPAAAEEDVAALVEAVRKHGDEALLRFTERFDGLAGRPLRVAPQEFDAAAGRVPDALRDAVAVARRTIGAFHPPPPGDESEVTTAPGVRCRRRLVPIDPVGLYIPAGTAPLFSSLLMLGIPARSAGCRRIVVCTPPGPEGRADDTVLYVAGLLGIDEVYMAGGAQAVAALAFGTETVPRTNKIFGPGNSYVTAAKRYVAGRYGVAVDMPAGPTEVMVLADEGAPPEFVAADLLAQAEHGPDSHVVLVGPSVDYLTRVTAALAAGLVDLPRRDVAAQALSRSVAAAVADPNRVVALAERYAAEHLVIARADAAEMAEKITCAGSVFVGYLASESLGDYSSGTNHVLPTGGTARGHEGVNVRSFLRAVTFQTVDEEGLASVGPAAETMAAAEGLEGHRRAVAVRRDAVAARRSDVSPAL